MKILREYILKDFLAAFLFSLMSLSMIMILVFLMISSNMVLRKGIDIFIALKTCSFYGLYLIGITLPFAFLLGILLSMGRLIADNEIVAIRTAGISLFKILNIFLIIGIIFALSLFILNDRVLPQLHYNYRSQIKSVYTKNIASLIEPGIFIEHFPNYILYVSDKKNNQLQNIFIYEIDNKGDTNKVTFAKRGKFVTEGDILRMKLEEGFRDQISSENKKELFRLNFKIFFVDIPINKNKSKKVEKKPCDMTIKELKTKANEFKKIGVDPTKFIAEFHKRISFAFSIMVYILLGFGLSLKVKHREKSINFGVAFIIGFFGYLLFILGETFVEYKILIPAIGMWLPNIVITLIGGYFLFKNAYLR